MTKIFVSCFFASVERARSLTFQNCSISNFQHHTWGGRPRLSNIQQVLIALKFYTTETFEQVFDDDVFGLSVLLHAQSFTRFQGLSRNEKNIFYVFSKRTFYTNI